jgi:YhcH/YjgK/YiaL family protein
MIVEKLENWRTLFSGLAWEAAFTAIEKLEEEAPLGKVGVLGEDGGDIFYSIADYATKPTAQCKLEAHREFIDIHFALRGAERIGWFPVDELNIKSPYHEEKDVAFFEHPQGEAPASVVLRPGMFVVMFPGDGHMPKMMVDGAAGALRKGVVKIRASLIGRQGGRVRTTA